MWMGDKKLEGVRSMEGELYIDAWGMAVTIWIYRPPSVAA